MAKTPTHTPGAPDPDKTSDPGSARVTMTQAELEAMMARVAAAAVAQAGVVRRPDLPKPNLPSMDEAKKMAADAIADERVPSAIETTDGWYVHPLCGMSVHDLREHLDNEAELVRRAKARRKAAKGGPSDEGSEGGSAD